MTETIYLCQKHYDEWQKQFKEKHKIIKIETIYRGIPESFDRYCEANGCFEKAIHQVTLET